MWIVLVLAILALGGAAAYFAPREEVVEAAEVSVEPAPLSPLGYGELEVFVETRGGWPDAPNIPFNGALVTFNSFSATTGKDGKCSFTNIPPGTYEVTAKHSTRSVRPTMVTMNWYPPVSKYIIVYAGKVTKVVLNLRLVQGW